MAKQLVERKAHYIGSWKTNIVTRDTISQINAQIQNEKGGKVRLQLYNDGLRVVKTALVMGKHLFEFLPVSSIYFLTVSQNTPNFLMVIAKSKDLSKGKYELQAFRCANGIDSGMFLEAFRDIRRKGQPGPAVDVNQPGHGLNADIATHDGINWTLRDKENDTSKRELKQLVDIHGEKAVVEKNAEVTVVVQNGHSSPRGQGQGEVRMYRKGKSHLQKATIEVDQVLPNGDLSDTHSESDNVSESALRVELDSLSQELRDIKFLLEKSTGMKAVHGEDVPAQFEKIPVKVHTTTVTKTTTTNVQRSDERGDDEDALDAVVLDDDDDEDDKGGYRMTLRTEERAGQEVRVSVPDYRTITERTSTSGSPPSHKKETSSGYGSVTSRTSTTSYDNWKRQTTGMPYNELQDRVQWRSRTIPVQTRPRTAYASWSAGHTGHPGHLRSSQIKVAQPHYKVVGYDPRMRTADMRVHSLRSRGFSTTVAKPIEKVYGRPESIHQSLVYRPNSANIRPTILANGSVRGSQQVVYVEPNNNAVKTEIVLDGTDSELLDVSGIDLDRAVPAETVIRT